MVNYNNAGVIVTAAPPTGKTAQDTVNLQAAITKLTTALASGPAALQLQDGTYQVDGNALVIRSVSNFAIRGGGRAVLQLAPNRAGKTANITGDILVIADCTDFRVEGLVLDGARDTIAPISVLTADAASGQPSVTIAAGQGARYIAGQVLSVFGGLYANGGTAGTNTLGADANKQDQNLTVSSVTPGGGSGGGDLVTFTANLANTYTHAAGVLSDAFGPYAANGAYLTPYQTASGNTVAGRGQMGGEDQQNGLHLLNCQRFTIHACTAKNVWESCFKLGTGFTAAPLGDACSDGVISDCTGYHGYDQGVSAWVSQRITVKGCELNSAGWAGISFTHSDACSAIGNDIYSSVYRVPGDANSGSGIAVEGGDGCVISGNQVVQPWAAGVLPRVSPLSFGVNTGSPPTLGAQLTAGTAAGTSVQVSSSAAFTVGATYCIMDAQRTEKIGIASVVDGTHVTLDRIPRFTHASGKQVNAAVATDTIISGNNIRDCQTGSLANIHSSARSIVKGNNLIGSAVLTGLASPFSFGVDCSQTGIGASTLGGEGSVIEGNVIGRTSNEAVYVNNTGFVTVRGNTIGPSSGGSTLVHEAGTGNNNRIEQNIYDSSVAASSCVATVGAATQVFEPSITNLNGSPVMARVAATPAAGVALVNGTPSILTWTAPNDGNLHWVFIATYVRVTSTETGGQVGISWTDPGGNGTSTGLVNGGKGTGATGTDSSSWSVNIAVQANTTVTFSQLTALTGGAATCWAEIWAN